MDYFKLAAELARAQLHAVEQHWLEQDVEHARALTVFQSMLTQDDVVRLWAYHINLKPDPR